MTSGERFARQSRIFQRACGLSEPGRAALLEIECLHDPDLRAEIELLLAAEDSVPFWLRDDRISTEAAARAAVALQDDEAAQHHPARIGEYHILGVLGAGGMGVVYRARQTHPSREVALKVMRYGAMSPQMIRRFEFEADILARLQHPGIAQVFEAGTWDDGGGARPYFAMELVEGAPLVAFATARTLDDRQRLELFVLVCHAVEHAHQKGVVHRDLKPDNILVTDDGRPKVLDFGIARATDSDVQVTTMLTSGSDLLGTLRYMSPEQVAGNGRDIDTRADVYALGVILYELLSGAAPHDLRTRSIAEAARIIVQDDPVPLRSVAGRCAGDLDTIVAMAMEKDRERRYSSAGALADDIARHLRDEAIAARLPTFFEQCRRLARRNRALAASVVLVFGTLVAATGFSTVMALRERSASTLAQANAAATVKQADRAERVKHLMIGMFAPVYPSRPDEKVTVEGMLAQAADRVRSELGDQPDIADEMYFVLGTIYQNLDLPQHAAPLLEELLARQKANGVPPTDYVTTLDQLAEVYNRDRDRARAVECQRQVLEIRRATEPATSINAVNALIGLAHMETYAADFDEAIRHCHEISALLDQVPEERPNQRFAAKLELGTALLRQGRHAEAEAIFREIIADPRYANSFWPRYYLADVLVERGGTGEAMVMTERLVSAMRAQRDVEPRRLGLVLRLNSRALESEGEYAQAEAAAREALAVIEALDISDTPSALNHVASTLHRQNRNEEAKDVIARSLEVLHQSPRNPLDEARSYELQALVLAELGDIDAARAAAGQALAIMRDTLPADHPKWAHPLVAMGEVEMRAGRPGAAAAHLREAMALLVEWRDPAHAQRVLVEDALARAFIEAGLYPEARSHLDGVIQRRTEALGDQSDHTRRAFELRDLLTSRLAFTEK